MDTREYEWSSVTAIVAGRDVKGIRGISYTPSQEKELMYAKGNKPHGIQRGNKDFKGSITLTQSEVDALSDAAGGDLLDVRCNIIVSYGNPSKGDVMRTDLLKGVEFTEKPKTMKQGDKFMEIELPIIMLDVVDNYR